jgi:glycosyltransferase involved in cell wall biosynthesis
LKEASVFKTVIPSKIFEIMSMARPVLLAVDGEARELVERANAGIFVRPEDHEGLARAVEMLYSRPEERELLGKNGRRFVEKYCDWDRISGDYLETLGHSLIDEAKA